MIHECVGSALSRTENKPLCRVIRLTKDVLGKVHYYNFILMSDSVKKKSLVAISSTLIAQLTFFTVLAFRIIY